MKPAAIDPPEIWDRLWHGFTGTVGWDVGANCGQTIPLQLERFQRVYAFEPAQECRPYLDSFDGDLRILPIALSDADGIIELMAIPEKIDTGQLVTAGVHGMEWDVDMDTAVARQVTAATIDSLITDGSDILAPDFIKIDVEGHELKVLYGARRTLATVRPDLLIEFHSPVLHEQCGNLLEGFGYDLETVRHPHYRPHSPLWHQHGWIRARQPR